MRSRFDAVSASSDKGGGFVDEAVKTGTPLAESL
jgi:hypothetical protein